LATKRGIAGLHKKNMLADRRDPKIAGNDWRECVMTGLPGARLAIARTPSLLSPRLQRDGKVTEF
jgi:hypothetical protein